MPVCVKMTGEKGADLSRAAGDEDTHVFKIRDVRYKVRDGVPISHAAGAVDSVLGGHGAVQSGDAVAVGIAGGIIELGGDAGFKFFRDKVLEAFGFVMEFVKGIMKHFKEESFDESVMADDFQRALAAGCRETDSAATLVLDERAVLGGELLQHVSDGGRCDAESFG